jgi:hypothetical protein
MAGLPDLSAKSAGTVGVAFVSIELTAVLNKLFELIKVVPVPTTPQYELSFGVSTRLFLTVVVKAVVDGIYIAAT